MFSLLYRKKNDELNMFDVMPSMHIPIVYILTA